MDSQLQREQSKLRTCLLVTLACLVVTGIYAYLRYVHFGPVLPSRIPLYVSNKMISWSALAMLCLSLGIGPLCRLIGPRPDWQPYRRSFGVIGLWLATLHIAVSLPIFNMFYYTSFFNFDGTLKMTSELSMLGGALAWCALLIPLVASLPSVKSSMTGATWQLFQQLSIYAVIAIFGHIAWLGWNGWFDPDSWFGGMPPITLLSCSIIVVLFLIKLFALFVNKESEVG